MKKALKAILLLLTVCLVVINAEAQVYPVSGNGVLIPPYSVYLADYTGGTSDRLVLNLVLNDVTRPELRVRLRTKIIGQNITLETKPEYIGKEFVLQGGIPLRITGSELTEYFSPANLNFSGITKREFEKTGALPAGFYQFCFEVLEYNRGVKISNSICANGWLILNDPPLINLPRNGEKLVPNQPQNVVFQWTPRHTGSPNSAFSTEYDIKLVELWPANRNPNDAILTSPPILEETTRSTTFIYDVSQTPLEAGRHYALQVKAKSIVGAEELDLFKNNGKSEVVTFIYGDPCTVPQSIFAESNSATRFTVKWTGALNHTGYSLKYRLADSPTADWYTNTTLLPDAGISGLLPGTTYEYQVAGSCGNFESEYSGIARIKTLSAGEQGYTCGMPLEQFNLDPANLIDVLKVDDVIQAGDFDVKVAKVYGSSGTFSGEGVIEVPFFNKAKVKAEFSSIVVNKDMRMVSGYMNVTGAGVEVVPSGVTSLIDQLSETLSALDTALTNIENNLPKPFDEFAFVADTMLTLPGPVIVSQETDGSVVIIDANGNEHRLPQGTEAAVVDDQGNGTLIDANGKAHDVSGAVATAAGNREYNLMLRFAESQSNHLYGFDAITSGVPDGLKKLYDKLEDNYYVPFKAIETGKTDLVSAILEGTAIDKSKLRFERGGIPVTASRFSGNNTTVTVSANMGGEQEALIAVLPAEEGAKDQVLGRVNVVTYNQIQKVVHIVPVNGNNYKFGSAGSLQNELNKIYSQAVVSWSVQIESGIQVEGINPFNVGETGLLTNYTDHMKKVLSAYKAAGMQNDENNFYLFLVNAPSDPKIAGYMPRSKQSGFIFYDQHSNEAAIARTMAHELGHGAFNLHHTFMEENFSLPKNSTDNLMDYAEGTKLYKYQWDMIRYPAVVMGVFESDEEGRDLSTNCIPISLLNPDTLTFNFITPSGRKITLPKGAAFTFRYGIINERYHQRPIGYLNSFKIRENGKDVEYVQATSASNTSFMGYVSKDGKLYEDTYTSKNVDDNIILMVPGSKGYTFIKYKIHLDPYKNGEAILTYLDFPIIPYSLGLSVIKSEFKDYNAVRGLLANENEQWTFDISALAAELSDFDEKPEHSYVLKIIELRTAYPALFTTFSSCWNKWDQSQSNSCWGYWETTILSRIPELKSKWKSDPVTYYRTFAEEFIAFTTAYRTINADFFAGDVVTKWKESNSKDGYRLDLLRVLTTLSNENVSSLISCQNRIGSLAILTEGSVIEPFEKEIVRLLRYVPDDQVACTLDDLKEESATGKGKLLYRLMHDVNDKHLWLGENNFKEFNKAIAELVFRHPTYTTQYRASQVDSKNTISFYDASFWARTKQAFAAYGNCYYPLLESSVVLDADCSISLTQKMVSGGINSGILPSAGPWADPYTLLLVANTSRLDMLSDISSETRAAVMPALMLEYMDWKGTEQFTIDGINAVLDVASTVSGIGTVSQLRYLSKIQKAARIFDLTSGVAGISSGLFEEQIAESPLLSNAINLIQVASAVTNLREAFKSASKAEDILKVVDEAADQAGQLNKVIKSLDEIEEQANTLRVISSKSDVGYLQKIEIYAYLKKLRADAETIVPPNQQILDQIVRIENKAGSIDEFIVNFNNLATGADDLVASLTGSIKSTYDDLIRVGLKSEVKANSILLKNSTGETVAIIYNGKLTPTKWAWQKNFSAANKTTTSEGYIIIKDGNELKFDLGFKDGRKLEAKEVNDYLVHGQGKDLDGQPYWAGTEVDEVILGKKGEVIYFVENSKIDGAIAPNPGQYASKDPITTIKELREKLAVKEAWKTTANEPTLRAYRVRADLKARSGTIGRQSDNGIELPGGAHQYEIIDYLGRNWENYLEPIGPRAGTKLK